MQINLKEIPEDFQLTRCEIGGDPCFLINPMKGKFPKWDRKTLIYRSSIWNYMGEPVSLSYKKFFNLEEAPELCPPPKDLNDSSLIEKLDGSTLIVSKYKGELITRTRGSVTTSEHDNGYEIEVLKNKYPACFDPSESQSYIFEWVSPTNKIVISYGDEPDILLTNVINHKDYSLTSQDDLDKIAVTLGVKRPKRYDFSSKEEMLKSIFELRGQEGVCIYSKRDQEIHKVKSAWYLACHRLRSELGSYERVVDLYFSLGMPNYNSFYEQIVTQFDFELAEQCKSQMSRICDGMKEVHTIIDAMKAKAELLKTWERKDSAIRIMAEYGQTSRSGMVFALLDGKSLTTENIKKLLFQVTKM